MKGPTSFKQNTLAGKVALITGGAGLLGIEHALALSDLGATIVLTDLPGDRLEQAAAHVRRLAGTELVQPLPLDVTSEQSVQAALDSVLARYQRIDILVNNAAIDPKVGGAGLVETSRLENFSLGDWQRQIDVGLTGALLCSRVFGGWMARNGGGVIVNVASDLSVFSPDQRLYRKADLPDDRQPVKPVSYSVIKTGLIGLTRYLATYWAEQGVRVNALSPGGVYVNQAADFVARLSALIPMGRMAERNEYHGALQFLCTDASRYMTGQNLVMDGGRSVW